MILAPCTSNTGEPAIVTGLKLAVPGPLVMCSVPAVMFSEPKLPLLPLAKSNVPLPLGSVVVVNDTLPLPPRCNVLPRARLRKPTFPPAMFRLDGAVTETALL